MRFAIATLSVVLLAGPLFAAGRSHSGSTHRVSSKSKVKSAPSHSAKGKIARPYKVQSHSSRSAKRKSNTCSFCAKQVQTPVKPVGKAQPSNMPRQPSVQVKAKDQKE